MNCKPKSFVGPVIGFNYIVLGHGSFFNLYMEDIEPAFYLGYLSIH